MLDPLGTSMSRLLCRLEEPDGGHWFDHCLDGSPGAPDELGAQLRQWLDLAEQLLRGEPEAIAFASGAVREALLDLAVVAPPSWSDRLASAALCGEADSGGKAEAAGEVGADVIGEYRLLSPVGGGGMGVVWEALQESTQRRVALKLVRSEVLTPATVTRFTAEGRLLARMDHAGIPKVLQMGVDTATGSPLPFLAMELVEGESLTDHLRSRDLGVWAKVRLLLAIVEAVAHAHGHGVVHRDLKPANIIIDRSGQPKVLDFGIARRIGEEPCVTRSGQLLGTLPYMSPEQLDGNTADVDERADVYALGAITYELLAGRPRYDVAGLPFLEAVSRIRRQQLASLDAIVAGLPRDLTVIVNKAMANERDRRYRGAGDLARDLERLLEGRPIEARPASIGYVLRKLLWRNRSLAITAAFLAIALVTGLGLALAGWAKARMAEEVASGFLDVSLRFARGLAESTADTEVVAETLAPMVALLDDPRWVRAENPQVLAGLGQLHDLLGDLALRRGDQGDAAGHRQEALSIAERLVRMNDGCSDYLARLSVALVKVGDLAKDRRDLGRARELYRRALEIDEAIVAASPDACDGLDNLIWSHLRLADLDRVMGANAAAVRGAEAALDLAGRLLAADPGRVASHLARLTAASALARMLAADVDAATRRAELCRLAIESAGRLVEADPERTAYRIAWIRASRQSTHLNLQMHDNESAHLHADEARRCAEALVALDPERADSHDVLAGALLDAAFVARQTGDGELAIGHLKAMVDQALLTAQMQPDSAHWRCRMAGLLARAGTTAHGLGDTENAERWGLRAVETYREVFAGGHANGEDVMTCLDLLGGGSIAAPRFAAVRADLMDAIAPERSADIEVVSRCEELLREQGDLRRAQALAERAERLQKATTRRR
ncbi:MAG: serine/threonine protein kinase [Planctomycetes bacterium]|nr:serine/threonine protein kinase [Planctomycetota bacterium]